jgi:hypothetical protein
MPTVTTGGTRSRYGVVLVANGAAAAPGKSRARRYGWRSSHGRPRQPKKCASPECWRLAGSAGKDRTGEATAIRSMTRKADEARIRQEMAAAIAAYAGPVTKCPPGKARGGTGKVKLLIRPRYRAKPPPVAPPRR